MSRLVLLVEDDATFSGLVERHLQGHGYRVAVAASVADATRWIQAAAASGEGPQVVLLDINLPDASGWELIRSGVLSQVGSPPVVVVTATTLSPRRLREHGVAGCLPKPFAMETLRSTIDRLMPPEEP